MCSADIDVALQHVGELTTYLSLIVKENRECKEKIAVLEAQLQELREKQKTKCNFYLTTYKRLISNLWAVPYETITDEVDAASYIEMKHLLGDATEEYIYRYAFLRHVASYSSDMLTDLKVFRHNRFSINYRLLYETFKDI